MQISKAISVSTLGSTNSIVLSVNCYFMDWEFVVADPGSFNRPPLKVRYSHSFT